MNLKNIMFSDFDYTLFEHGSPQETAANLYQVKRWRSAGNLFIIATGRGLVSLSLELPNYYEYADYLILNDGATIISPIDGMICTDRFSAKLVESINSSLSELSFKGNHAIISYYGNKELPFIKEGCYKFRVWFDNHEDTDAFEEFLTNEFGRRLHYIAYRDVDFNHDLRLPWITEEYTDSFEINLFGTNKGKAVRNLLERLNIRNNGKNITTIGDDRNDLTMIEEYNGYAVERAHPDVIHRIPATHVVPHLHNLIAKKLSLT